MLRCGRAVMQRQVRAVVVGAAGPVVRRRAGQAVLVGTAGAGGLAGWSSCWGWGKQDQEQGQGQGMGQEEKPKEAVVAVVEAAQAQQNGEIGEIGDVVDISAMGDSLMDKALHGGTTFTFGGIMGFCSGVALKKVGKVVVVITGGVFSLFQLAASRGYIEINWDKVSEDFQGKLDLNGDGKLDGKDLQLALQNTTAVLTNNMAATAGGFTAGFLLGLRRG